MRPGLNRSAITAAVVRVVEAEGREAVTTARVAAELHVTEHALRAHVATAAGLLALVEDQA